MKKLGFALAGLCLLALPAQAQSTAEMLRVKAACEVDAAALCAGVQPGGGRILACLKGQQDKLSANCRAMLPRAEQMKNEAQASGQLPK